MNCPQTRRVAAQEAASSPDRPIGRSDQDQTTAPEPGQTEPSLASLENLALRFEGLASALHSLRHRAPQLASDASMMASLVAGATTAAGDLGRFVLDALRHQEVA